MLRDSEKYQLINWGRFYLGFSRVWEESDTRAYKTLIRSLRFKTALNYIVCREFLKWGWFYMENSPDYNPSSEFFVFNCILRMFDEKQLINVAKHVLPPVRSPMIPIF